MGDQYEPLGPASGLPPSAPPPPAAANIAAGTDAGGKTEVFCATPQDKTDLKSVIDFGKKQATQEEEKTDLQSLQEESNRSSPEKPPGTEAEAKRGKKSAKDKKPIEESSGRPVHPKERPVKSESRLKIPLTQKPVFFFIMSALFFIISIVCFAYLASDERVIHQPETMIVDFYTIVFVFAITLLVIVLSVIFTKRQALRMRNNSARKEVSGVIASELSKSVRDAIVTRINGVGRFRQVHVPTFTDCTIISDHASSPYVYRMIAIDEIAENIDRQVEMIDPTAGRRPGESTYCFLRRLRECAGCRISLSQVDRIGFLHELCRFRPQWAFDSTHLKELRGLLKDFLKILNEWQKNRSEADGKASDSDDAAASCKSSNPKLRHTSLFNGSGERLASNNQQIDLRPLLSETSRPISSPHSDGLRTAASDNIGEDETLLVRTKTNARS